jgi:hypothetical protein
MKTILLCTDGSSFAENVYKYGAWFATKVNAQINVLSVTDIRSQKVASTGNLSGTIGLGASEQLQVMSHKAISSVALSIWNCPP